jgi:hypothetical protein
MEILDIEKIRLDGGTQMRASLNADTIGEYADAMVEGAKFPPIVVFYDGTDYWLGDGFHRVHAAKSKGFREIETDVRAGTVRDAILCAIQANAQHGLRRTNADKRRAVETLLRDEEWRSWSDHQIAREACVDVKTVSRWRGDLSAIYGSSTDSPRKVERGGTTYTMKTENIGVRTERERPYPDPLQAQIRADCRAVDQRVAAVRSGELEISPPREDHAQEVMDDIYDRITGHLAGAQARILVDRVIAFYGQDWHL